MNAIRFYRHESNGQVELEYNFYDHKFAPTNLVVQKILMAMLQATEPLLTKLEVEYNDNMLAEKLGGRAATILQKLGATTSTVKENLANGVVISRVFEAELTPDRYAYFYNLKDVSELQRFVLKDEEVERVTSFFNQYLLLRIPHEYEQRFYDNLNQLHVPYSVVEVKK
ncbi:hypothetical protein [Brevibacillus daliensis]|uniref:hypothetical protein n=1 Tax=Brevibacillus daliensis TaxID=2892995 RepID=UPI001E3E930B|nr:hypothetical protein [Brevibacillus daliensis]